MTQQIIALIVILFFVLKQTQAYRKDAIAKPEYYFWLIFWFATGLVILFLPFIDRLVAQLGFSASGISVLTELAVAILFYFIFRMRLRLAKLEKDLTKIVEALAIKNQR
jgi:hypothetical protein